MAAKLFLKNYHQEQKIYYLCNWCIVFFYVTTHRCFQFKLQPYSLSNQVTSEGWDTDIY